MLSLRDSGTGNPSRTVTKTKKARTVAKTPQRPVDCPRSGYNCAGRRFEEALIRTIAIVSMMFVFRGVLHAGMNTHDSAKRLTAIE